MTLKVYLVRHGETETNRQKKKWDQHPDTSINELGVEQAKKLSNRLKKIKFNKIFSSDIKRAVQTTEILKQEIKAPLFMDERLREYDSGKVDQSSEEWKKKYDQLFEQGFSKEEIRPFGGENIWDLIKRTKSFIKDLEKEKGTILIVSHSGFNETFINISQLREKNNFVKIKQDNTCINLLEYLNGEWVIRVINDSEHISNFLPEIKVYKNQDKIKEEIKETILNKIGDFCGNIVTIGDFAENKISFYDRPHKRHWGSSIEIFAKFKDNFEIPKDWKISEINENFQRYEIGSIKIDEVKHKLNVTVPFEALQRNAIKEVIK